MQASGLAQVIYEDVVRNMSKALIIIGVIIFFLAIFGYFSNKRQEKMLRQLSDSRPKLTRTEYINQLVEMGFERYQSEVVHDEIRKFIEIDDFSIYPEDDIHKIYGVENLDDVELIDSICKKLNLREVVQQDIDELDKTLKTFNAEYILTLINHISV